MPDRYGTAGLPSPEAGNDAYCFTTDSNPLRASASGARASIEFRIVITAIIRVTAVTQPDRIVIEEQHIAQGYIDLVAGPSVKLTANSREGYLLTASYDSQLLSRVGVRVSSQNLTASSGLGSMRVASGLTIVSWFPSATAFNWRSERTQATIADRCLSGLVFSDRGESPRSRANALGAVLHCIRFAPILTRVVSRVETGAVIF